MLLFVGPVPGYPNTIQIAILGCLQVGSELCNPNRPDISPAHVRTLWRHSGGGCPSALGLGQHPGIWVDSNDAFEEVGEEQSDSAGPATDVEEAPTTIEMEVLGECIGQGRGVWFAALSVVGGGALEHGLVPDPVLP